MNLNNHPTKEQLKDLFRVADDDAGHHIMWIDTAGEVRVTLLPKGVTVSGWERAFPSTRFRFETFCQGNGYVGPDAADDDDHVRMYFNWIMKTWAERGKVGKSEFVDR